MTDSARSGCGLDRWLRTAVLGLASAVLLSVATVAAQPLVGEGEPINLLPRPDPNTSPDTSTDPTTGTGTGAAMPEGFQIETLEEVSGEFSGPLTP